MSKEMTALAAQRHPGVTYAQWRKAGWTDEQLLAHGYLEPAATPPAPTLDELKAALDRAIVQKRAIEIAGGGPALIEANKEFQRAHRAYWDAVGAMHEPDAAVSEKASAESYTTLVDRTDQGNANLLVRLANGDLRYVAETKQWMRWDGRRWHIDRHEEFISTFALEVAKLYMEDARQQKAGGRTDLADQQMKWATKCRNKTALDAMISLARKKPGVPISISELDRNPWLLGVENGVVDLRTGQLREKEAREDYVTKRCAIPYNPNATAPRWEQFIVEVTGAPIQAERDIHGHVIPNTVGRFTSRPTLAQYVHKALGYTATGTTQEQKFFLAIGGGSNGKSLVFALLQEIMGPYAIPIPPEFFTTVKHAQDAERPTSVAASLAGKRLVVTSETKEGQKLEMAVIKAHTGDDKITARGMRQDPVTFEITHKPWLLTNAAPGIEHLDAAMRGRLHALPFDRQWNRPGEAERDPELPDGDKTLKEQLRAEREGILAWLVRGAVLYNKDGLDPPPEVVAFTAEYIARQDHLGRWLATMERCPPEQGTKASDLFLAFTTWCAADGCMPNERSQTAFSTALKKKKVAKKDAEVGAMWGLRVPPPARTAHATTSAVVFGDKTPPLPPGAMPIPPRP